MTYDDRATARVETNNTTILLAQQVGKIDLTTILSTKPIIMQGQQVKVEWKGSWWDGLIREVQGDNYLIHYVGFDSSWDEWVDDSRLQNL